MDKTKLLWFAFLNSIAIYAAIPLLLDPAAADPQPVVGFALMGSAALAAALSFVVPGIFERQAAVERPENFELTGWLLRWIFAETVAIFGLVLFILGHGASYAWGFATVAGILMLVHSPRARATSSAQAGASAQDLARSDIKIG